MLLKTFVVMAVAIAVTLAAMKFLTPREISESLDDQFRHLQKRSTTGS